MKKGERRKTKQARWTEFACRKLGDPSDPIVVLTMRGTGSAGCANALDLEVSREWGGDVQHLAASSSAKKGARII
jgi:hypothetical protein